MSPNVQWAIQNLVVQGLNVLAKVKTEGAEEEGGAAKLGSKTPDGCFGGAPSGAMSLISWKCRGLGQPQTV